MEKDLSNFKKWFKNLGLEINGKIDDEVLKKLMPPQRRDMWRHIIKHVLPEEEVELIKKAILLHKLQKLQQPLMAKVEYIEDLADALKYGELMTKYNKIQKEIINVKLNNEKIKSDLNEKYEMKNKLIQTIELKQGKMYLAKQKIESHNKHIEVLKEMSDISNAFSIEANENLTATDYEDSLIKCLIEVDDAKQSGTMNDSVNVGKQLCNALYSAIHDKSPSVLLKTIEGNLTNHIDRSNEIINEVNSATERDNDNESEFNELLVKLFQNQLELKSKLSCTLTEKERMSQNLKETTRLVKDEIINKYKLKNISYSDDEFLAFKEDLKKAMETVIKTSINCSKITGNEENSFKKETFEMLDNIFDKTNILNQEIDQKRIIVCEMLKEVHDKKSDFGLAEVKTVMEKLAEYYLENVHDNHLTTINSIKNSCCDVDYINKLLIKSTPKSNTVKFQTLQDMKKCSEMIDIISETKIKFKQSDLVSSAQNNLNEITQNENMHKSEFESIITEMENNILKLNSNIEDCELIANIVLNKRLQNNLSEK